MIISPEVLATLFVSWNCWITIALIKIMIDTNVIKTKISKEN